MIYLLHGFTNGYHPQSSIAFRPPPPTTSHLIWRKVICAWVKNNKETWKYWLPLREPNHAHCRNSSQPLRQVCSGHGACVAASAANAFPPSACQCNAGFSGSTCERTDGGKSAAYALAVTKQVNRLLEYT